MREWIAITDKLPESGQEVLVVWPLLCYDEDHDQLTDEVERHTVQKSIYQAGQFADPVGADAIGDYFGDDYEYAKEPTHWMALPDLPAGLKPPREK